MGRKSTLDGWWRAEVTPKTYDSSGNALPWGRGGMTVGRRKWKCADQEPVLPLFPLLAVRMKVLAGRKKCHAGLFAAEEPAGVPCCASCGPHGVSCGPHECCLGSAPSPD